MPESRFDLLRDQLFRLHSADGEEHHATLPAVLARLGGGGDVASFSALQAHQVHAWHAFLVQLAALALHRGGETDPGHDEAAWLERLLLLTDGASEPWTLVVPDLDRPAFLQPPVPEGTLDRFKGQVLEPDALDILVTTKNHDVKAARIASPSPEHWVYALVSLQTTQGYSGRHPPDACYYGIIRMNGGFGNRPCFGLSPSLDSASRFRRDLQVLLGECTMSLAGAYGYPAEGGAALLWLEPWNGADTIPLQQCDPFFIEVCRRVRLVQERGRVVARTAPSKAKRIAASVDTGDTGDPWTPVRIEDGAALTLDGSGFTYRRVQQLLFDGDYRLGPAAVVQPNDRGDMWLVAQALVRGDGRTDGLHTRTIPVPSRIRHRLGHPEQRKSLAELAQRQVEQAALVDRKILNPALCTLLQGAPEKIDLKDRRARRWRDRFDAEVDRAFFPRLWENADLDPLEAEHRWTGLLRDLALAQFEDAIRSARVSDARRYRAVAVAERVLRGALRNNFPSLFPPAERRSDEPISTD